MTEQENVQIAKDGYAAFVNGDIASVLNFYAEDAEFISNGPTGVIPWVGTYKGHEQMVQFFTKLAEAFEIELFEAEEYIAQGNKIAVIVRNIGTYKSTGKKIESRLVHVWTMQNGKVARFEIFDDNSLMLV
jgi:uncharacterized protein